MRLMVDIKKQFKKFKLDVSFKCDGKTIGLLGGSGSGKSMTLRCIAGLVTPDEGKIVYGDKVFFDSCKGINLPAQERGIGFLFQNYALFPHMTLEENVGFGLHHLTKKERRAVVEEHLDRMQLGHLKKSYPGQLSGGQQQRAAIARAMAAQPEMLILDEPFSALDNHLRVRMEHELMKVIGGYRGTTLMVSHDVNELYRISEDILTYHDGKIVNGGKKERLFQEPEHVQAAVITGCKNIVGCKAMIDGEKVAVSDWGVELKVKRPLDNNEHIIGIRAHHFKAHLAMDDTSREEHLKRENYFDVKIHEVVVSPFRVIVYFYFGEAEIKGRLEEALLKWDVSRERWDMLKQYSKHLILEIPKEKILLLKE